MTSMFFSRSSQTSFPDLFLIIILFVNFSETPQEYVGTLCIFASLTRVEVPILFATSDFVKASAPKRKRSHFARECSAARSGAMITFILAFARSFAVILPWRRGSTSVV